MPEYRHTDALAALDAAQTSLADVRRILMGAGQPEPPPGYTLSPGDDPAVAMADLKAGDTLYLADGTHPYPIHILHEAMTVKAAPGADPVVSGWSRIVQWEESGKNAQGVSVYYTPYDRFGGRLHHRFSQNQNLDTARRDAHNRAAAPDLVADEVGTLMDSAYRYDDIQAKGAMYDEKHHRLYYGVSPSLSPIIHIARYPTLLTAADGVGGLTVEGIMFEGCANTTKQGAVHIHSDGNTFRDLIVRDVNSIAYSIWGMGTKMERLRSMRAGQMGFHCRIGKSLVRGCGHTGSNWGGFDAGWEAGCKFEFSNDNAISEWYAADCDGPGLWFDRSNHRNHVEGLTLYSCQKSALLVEHYAEDNLFEAGEIADTRRWAATGRGAALQIQSNVKSNVFRDITITGTEDDTAVVIKTNEKRGGSGPNTYDNVQADGSWRFEGGKHEKDVFLNMDVPT